MKIGLVGCVKSKRAQRAAARDLYTSTLFAGRRRWVERTCDQWFVLSAQHGLVDPDAVLEPYDVTLMTASSLEKRKWADHVLSTLAEAIGPFDRHVFEIHAGDAYTEFGLIDGLRRGGARVDRPTAGLPLGIQLQFYAG
jgi:hypothetical protein